MKRRYWLDVTLRLAVTAEPEEAEGRTSAFRDAVAREVFGELGPDCQLHQVRLLTEDGEEVPCSD